MVLTVKGRVGLVEDGSTCERPQTLMMSGRMAAAGAFGVEGVDGAALHRRDGIFDEAALVQGVGVDHHLHVEGVGDAEAAVDRRRGGAPVLMQFQRAGAALHHLLQRRRGGGVAFAGEAEIHREGVERLQHPADVPGAGGAGGGEGAVGRAGAAAEHGGQAGMQRVLDLLRADEMDMGVEAACGEDLALARDRLGAGADDDVDAGLGVRVARLADLDDAAILEADVGFVDAGPVDDQGVGDHGVHRAARAGGLRLAHAVADDLAAAEFHLLAIGGEVFLNLDEQLSVCEADLVARGGAVHGGVVAAGD